MDGSDPARESSDAGAGTIGKALDVLDQVAAFGRPVRFTDLLVESPFPKATLYRMLQSLTKLGMLSYDPDRQVYMLGIRLVRLAHAAWAQSSLAAVARPHLDELSRQIGETVHLAQLDHAQVLYVDKRNAARPISMFSEAGKVGPAYCTGIGKAMMAFLNEEELGRVLPQQSFHRFTEHTISNETDLRAELAEIRKCGYAFDREEHETGIICVAMPVLNRRGRVLGGLSVTGSSARTNYATLKSFIPLIRSAVDRIGSEAEAWQFPDDIALIQSNETNQGRRQ